MTDRVNKEDVSVKIKNTKKTNQVSKKNKKNNDTKLEKKKTIGNSNSSKINKKKFNQSEFANQNEVTTNSFSSSQNHIIIPGTSKKLIGKIKLMQIISIVMTGIFCILFIFFLIYFNIKMKYLDKLISVKLSLGLASSFGLLAVNIRILRFLCICPYPYFNKCWVLYVLTIAILVLGVFIFGCVTMQYNGGIPLLGADDLEQYKTGVTSLLSLILIISNGMYLGIIIIFLIFMKKHQKSLSPIEASLGNYQYSGMQIFCVSQNADNCGCRTRGCCCCED